MYFAAVSAMTPWLRSITRFWGRLSDPTKDNLFFVMIRLLESTVTEAMSSIVLYAMQWDLIQMIVHTNLRVSPWTPMMHSIFQIIRGLIHLPSEIDNVKSGLTRSKRKHEPSRYGASQCWVPAGTELISKNYHVRLKNSAAISKNLDNLFGCEKSCFSREALTTMAA